MICGLAFACHGFFDVSAHRIGTLWPALFLASIAVYPEEQSRTSQTIVWSFRALALLLLTVSGWWFVSILGESDIPTSASVTRLEEGAERAVANADYERARERAETGLKIATLDWLLYYHRGVAEAALYRPRSEVSRDFAIARYLFPYWPDLYLQEGEVWLDLDEPDLAFSIWEEGMQRLGPGAFFLYEGILVRVRDDAGLRDRWRKLDRADPRYLPFFLASVNATEFELERERIFAEDPALTSFSPAEQELLFQTWYQKGDKLSLAETVRAHPEWEKIAWRQLALALADLQDYRQAYETVARHSSRPALPEIDPRQVPLLSARFQVTRDLGRDGLELALAQFKSATPESALHTIEIASAARGAPRELHYIAAQIWSAKGDWRKAWESIAKYEDIR
jgi:hypothetical protein